jgi:hypothetical protein
MTEIPLWAELPDAAGTLRGIVQIAGGRSLRRV